jgi:hypothetical protein
MTCRRDSLTTSRNPAEDSKRAPAGVAGPRISAPRRDAAARVSFIRTAARVDRSQMASSMA